MGQCRAGTINGVPQVLQWMTLWGHGPRCRARIEGWRMPNGDRVETHCSSIATHGRFCKRHASGGPMLTALRKIASARGIEIVED